MKESEWKLKDEKDHKKHKKDEKHDFRCSSNSSDTCKTEQPKQESEVAEKPVNPKKWQLKAMTTKKERKKEQQSPCMENVEEKRNLLAMYANQRTDLVFQSSASRICFEK